MEQMGEDGEEADNVRRTVCNVDVIIGGRSLEPPVGSLDLLGGVFQQLRNDIGA